MARPMYVKVSDIQRDADQYFIYNLSTDAKYVVSGCAGSGKTSLALLLLERIIGSCGEDDARPNPVYYIATVHELVEQVRKQFRQFNKVPRFNDYAITRAAWSAGIISDLQRKQQNPRGSHLIQGRRCMNGLPYGPYGNWIDLIINKNPDYLLIDEAQDFDFATISNFIASAKKGCVFYGDDSQKIMKNGTSLDAICNVLGLEKHSLKRNWRLSKEIAAFAQELPGQKKDAELVRRCRGEYKQKPYVIGLQDENSIKSFILERCKKATKDDDVGIILRSNRDIEEWYQYFSWQLGTDMVSARYSYDEQSPSAVSSGWAYPASPVAFSTPFAMKPLSRTRMSSHYDYLRDTPVKILRYEDAKGQQFRDVYVIAEEQLLQQDEGMNCFYVGVTRAERSLYVLYSGLKPSYLQNIDPDLYSTSDKVVVDF